MSSPKPNMGSAGRGALTQRFYRFKTRWKRRGNTRNRYGLSWEISKAFDSVGRPLIRFAWERVGVPDEIINWLIELDRDNHTVVRSTLAVEVWVAQGYEDFANDDDSKACYFDPERGTGQGDISSPQSWIVFFDIILRALE